MKELVEHIQQEQNQISELNWKQMAGGAAIAGALLTGTPQFAEATPPVQAEQSSSYFSDKELSCKCCKQAKISAELKKKLELLRRRLGNKVIIVTSGYRCPKHNAAVGGAKHSQHMLGKAADIKVEGVSPAEVAKAAKEVGFTFVKVYSSWTHVDVR